MAGIGHNSGFIGGATAAEDLRRYAERIERLEAEKKGIGDDIRDVYAEVKSKGYEPKHLRRALRTKAQLEKDAEKKKQDDEEYKTYCIALGIDDLF